MYQVNKGYLVNLQEQERMRQEMAFAPERAKILQAVEANDMVVYKPEKPAKGHIYVFTDIDCGFCRKLHSRMAEILEGRWRWQSSSCRRYVFCSFKVITITICATFTIF